MSEPSPPSKSESSIGGIVLCGGKSSRMGQPKHLLPFGNSTTLERVVDTLQQVVNPIVVVRAAGMPLPELPASVQITEDETPDLGPLAGIAAGMQALRDCCQLAYISACDSPLLLPDVVRYLCQQSQDVDVAVFREGEFQHVLAGVYSLGLLPRVRELIAQNRLRPLFLLEHGARLIDVEDVRHIDPGLNSFRNANTAEEYEELLRLAKSIP